MPTREVHPRAGDPRALPAHRQATSASTTTPVSPPRSPTSSGTTTAHRWIIRTDRGDAHAGQVRRAWAPARCTGPKLPGIPGIETFAGHSFHTSRWDYGYTGGDPSGAPDDRPGRQAGRHHRHRRHRRCSASRTWPGGAGELFVFQRTPSSIDIRNNHAIDPDWFASLEPGWQEQVADELHHPPDRRVRRRGPGEGRLDRHLPAHPRPHHGRHRQRRRVQRRTRSARPTRTATTRRWRRSGPGSTRSSPTRPRPRSSSRGTASCASGRASTTSTCDAYNEPDTPPVDTDGKGVERIDETGVWVGGVHYELDCLIYASGFEVGTELARRAGLRPGRPRRPGACRSTGPTACRACTASTCTASRTSSSSARPRAPTSSPTCRTTSPRPARTIAAVIAHAEAIGADEVEVTAEAEEAWVAKIETSDRGRSSATSSARPATTTTKARRPAARASSPAATPTARSRTSPTSTRGAARASSTASTSAPPRRTDPGRHRWLGARCGGQLRIGEAGSLAWAGIALVVLGHAVGSVGGQEQAIGQLPVLVDGLVVRGPSPNPGSA